MKVRSLRLKCFKRFEDTTFNFVDEETGRARDLLVVLGRNGEGKSTLLQSIAATLGTATRRLRHPSELAWPGFDLSLAVRNWHEPSEVEVEVEFTDAEIEATRLYYGLVREMAPEHMVTEPGSARIVRLHLRPDEDRVVADGSGAALFQCRGREYARQALRRLGPDAFERVGGVFWYPELRDPNRLAAEWPEGESLVLEVDKLRRQLERWVYAHKDRAADPARRAGERDYLDVFQGLFTELFPGRSLAGVSLDDGPDKILSEPFIDMTDGERRYDLAEMSGGERSVFPLLFDFARLRLNHSVILIDELELHLERSRQQQLLRLLRGHGHNNQVLLTTHSRAVTDMVPESAIIRLGGER